MGVGVAPTSPRQLAAGTTSFAGPWSVLSAQTTATVKAIGAALEPFAFDTIYGHYFDRVIRTDGKQILKASVERYLKAIGAS